MGFFTVTAKFYLLGLTLLGAYATWGFAKQNTLFDQLNASIDHPFPVLPGTSHELRKHWLGVEGLDRFISTFATFFWPVIDGEMPELSLQGIHFYAQLLSTWMLMLVEASRIGNNWRLVSFITITGILIENVAMAIIVPLWCLIHLLTSPTMNDSLQPATRQINLLVHPAQLRLLPWSILLGCGIPTMFILITDPAVTTPYYQSPQFWIAVRQLHPLWTAIIQLVLSILMGPAANQYASKEDRNRAVSKSLRYVYDIAMYIAALPHTILLTLAIAARLVPSMFSDSFRPSLNLITIFLPTSFLGNGPTVIASSIAHGSQMFLQWDELVSCFSILVWAFALNRNALYADPKGSRFVATIFKTATMLIIGGPAVAAIALVKERDETILDDTVIPEVEEVSDEHLERRGIKS